LLFHINIETVAKTIIYVKPFSYKKLEQQTFTEHSKHNTNREDTSKFLMMNALSSVNDDYSYLTPGYVFPFFHSKLTCLRKQPLFNKVHAVLKPTTLKHVS